MPEQRTMEKASQHTREGKPRSQSGELVDEKKEQNLLSEIIIDKIRRNGPVSFYDFMEMALYYPDCGYYTSGKNRIGENGDYYTSPCITSLLGQMLARQIEEMWCLLKPEEFTIVEYGAGTGLLCMDIVNQLKHNRKLYDGFQYCIIEKNFLLPEKQILFTDEKIIRRQSINENGKFTGCILSNEVIDNFPVHQVIMQDELMEVFIDYENGFAEKLQPASEPLRNYFEELKIRLPKNFRTEVNLKAIEWISEITPALHKGFVITMDYGFPSAELYSSKRSSGTLVCYHKHRINFCPYIHIGQQDITTHINFSALHHWGLKNGLSLCGFTNQSSFLLSLGLCNHLRKTERTMSNQPAGDHQKAWLLQTFLMNMGQKIKVMIQKKGIEPAPLSGLQFSEPATALSTL